ncbi:MAG: hypothetical protein ACPG5P_02365 [Saprospiraceae bacterium]
MIPKTSFNIEMRLAQFMEMGISHDYHASGISKDFEFIPTKQTTETFKKLGIIFKSKKGMFNLFCNPNRIEQVLKYLQKPLTFQFYLILKNKTFQNFTETKIGDFNRIFFLDSDSFPHKGKTLLLGGKNYFSKDNSVPALSTGTKIPLPIPSKKKSKLILRDSSGEIFKQTKFDKTNPMESLEKPFLYQNDELFLDTKGFDEGLYKMNMGAKEDISFLLFNEYPTGTYGIIQIRGWDEKPKGVSYSFVKGDGFSFTKPSISFNARTTIWKYTIVDKKNGVHNIDAVKVLDTDGTELKTTKIKKERLRDGGECIVFELEKTKQLKEQLSTKDRLSIELKRNGKWLIKPFNLPKPNNTSRIEFKGEKVYSNVFFNL